MRLSHSLMACALVGLCGSANAADNGVYAGVSIGRTRSDVQPLSNGAIDDEDTGFKLLLGLRPLDWVGVEVNYINLGKVSRRGGSGGGTFPDFAGFRVEQTGFGASGLLFYDIANVDLFARAGLFRWDASASVDTLFGRFRVSDSGTDLTWGAGAQVRFGSLAARLEFERFEIDRNDGFAGTPHLISVGATWTFF